MYSTVIIDDEINVIEALSTLIEEICSEFEIVGIAESFKKGRQLITKKNPDLVFLDINMPDGNGMELLDFFPTRSFEVVFISGYSKLEPLADEYQPFGFLIKPIEINALKKILMNFQSFQKNNSKRNIKRKFLF